MLHRSFKPAKCKTALKLASARIKLLKNKKQGAYKQLKMEVSILLESGQDRTARIRVEHVIREEKMMEAYELIEIYCEQIVARLPMIESQKNCPIDLKEAITGVIFAAPRCADVPELVEVRKLFKVKYGKEFISSAVELRPNCGVNRMLIEKLSATTPDIQTKVKVLSAIAAEHNIKWNPNALEEKDGKPAEEVNEVLNGPSTFQSASQVYVEPPIVQAHMPPPPEKSPDLPVNPSEYSRNSSSSSSNMTSTSFHAEQKLSGTRTESKESEHSFSGERNDFATGKQNFNTEFKTAAEAAQAAAEAAERATMAAKAAAELSTNEKLARQHSKESQKPPVHSVQSEEDRFNRVGSTKLQGDNNSMKKSFHITSSSSSVNHGRTDGNEKDNLDDKGRMVNSHSRKSSRTPSMKSTKKTDEEIFVNLTSSPKVNEYYPVDPSDDMASKPIEHPSKFNEIGNREDVKTEFFDCLEEEEITIKSNIASPHSHSNIPIDDHELVATPKQDKFENDFGYDLYVNMDHEVTETETKPAHIDDHDVLAFDNYASDHSEVKYTEEDNFNKPESTFFTSPNNNSPIYTESSYSSISEQNKSKFSAISILQSHHFTEPPEVSDDPVKPEELAEPVDLPPVAFDQSDGSGSEIEEELVKSSSDEIDVLPPANQKSSRGGKKSQIGSGEIDDVKPWKAPKLSWAHESKEDDNPSEESSSDESNTLKYGGLRGGLRNKGNSTRPAYTKSKDEDTFSDSQNQKVGKKGHKKSKAQVTPPASDSDEIEESGKKTGRKMSNETNSKKKSTFIDSDAKDQKISSKREKKSHVKSPISSSDTDSDDLIKNLATGKKISSKKQGPSLDSDAQDHKNRTKKVRKPLADTSDAEGDDFKEDSSSQKRSQKVTSSKNKGTSFDPEAHNQKMSTKKEKKVVKAPVISTDSDSEDLIEESRQKTVKKSSSDNVASSKKQGTTFDSDAQKRKISSKREKKSYAKSQDTSSEADSDDINEKQASKKTSRKMNHEEEPQNKKVSTKKEKKSYVKSPIISSDSDSEDLIEELASDKKGRKSTIVTNSRKQGTSFDLDVHNQKTSKKTEKKPYLKPPVTSSDSDSDDLIQELFGKKKGQKTTYAASSKKEDALIDSESSKKKVSTKREKRSYAKAHVTSSDSDSDDAKLSNVTTSQERKKSHKKAIITPSDSDSEDLASQKTGLKFISVTSSKKQSIAFDSDAQKKKMGIKGQKKSYVTSSDSDGEDPNEKIVLKLNEATSSKRQGKSFDSDLKEELPQQNLTSQGRLGATAISRRTKVTPTIPEKSSYSKINDLEENSLTWRPSKTTYAIGKTNSTESKPTPNPTQKSKTFLLDEKTRKPAFERPSSTEQNPISKPIPESKNSFGAERLRKSAFEKPSSSFEGKSESSKIPVEKPIPIEQKLASATVESKNSFPTEERPRISKFEKPSSPFVSKTEKPSTIEQQQPVSKPLPEQNPKASTFEKPSSSSVGETGSEKTQSSSEKIPVRENSMKKAPHVHPKLPDYDSFAAHFEALRSNQK